MGQEVLGGDVVQRRDEGGSIIRNIDEWYATVYEHVLDAQAEEGRSEDDEEGPGEEGGEVSKPGESHAKREQPLCGAQLKEVHTTSLGIGGESRSVQWHICALDRDNHRDHECTACGHTWPNEDHDPSPDSLDTTGGYGPTESQLADMRDAGRPGQ